MEKWIKINELDGYEISNMGRLRSVDRIIERGNQKVKYKGKIRKLFNDGNGYLIVRIKNRTLKIHRFVAKYFIQNPNDKKCVNHINGIKTDNRAENLEWVTSSENNKHAFLTGLKKGNNGEKSGMAKFTNEQVEVIREMYNSGRTNYSELGRLFNVKGDTIANIIKRVSYTK